MLRVTGVLGIWLARDADDQSDLDAAEITVAYYLAEQTGESASDLDAAETAEVRWFELDAGRRRRFRNGRSVERPRTLSSRPGVRSRAGD